MNTNFTWEGANVDKQWRNILRQYYYSKIDKKLTEDNQDNRSQGLEEDVEEQ